MHVSVAVERAYATRGTKRGCIQYDCIIIRPRAAVLSWQAPRSNLPLPVSTYVCVCAVLQYAVRGAVLERSMELQRKMAAGEKLPFDKVKSTPNVMVDVR